MKCPTCGFELTENTTVCPNCGAVLSDGAAGEPAAEEPKDFGEDAASPEEEADFGGNGTPPEEKKKRKIWPIILIIALIAAALAAWLGTRYYNKHYVVHEIHLGEKALDLIVGDTAQLSFEILPETAKNRTVTWESSDSAVASVSEEGLVTAAGSGQCEVTVTTNNGKTDVCEVHVKDLVDIQKESVDAVAEYIRSNNPVDENGVSISKIRDVDEESTFALGTVGEDLVLCYRDAVNVESVDVDVQYTTYMNLGYGNLETAEIVQDNQVTVFGNPITSTMRGTVPVPEYQRGAPVEISSFESNFDGMQLNDKMQKQFNSGVKGCFEEFRAFLEYHPEIGASIEDFGFTAVGDYPEPEPEVTPDQSVDSMAESIAEEVFSRPDSSVTVVEEIAEPWGAESAVSSAAEVTSEVESAVEPVIPAVPEAESAAAEPVVPMLPEAESVAAEPAVPALPEAESVAAEPVLPDAESPAEAESVPAAAAESAAEIPAVPAPILTEAESAPDRVESIPEGPVLVPAVPEEVPAASVQEDIIEAPEVSAMEEAAAGRGAAEPVTVMKGCMAQAPCCARRRTSVRRPEIGRAHV